MAWPTMPKRLVYALKVLICLAKSPSNPVSSREAARCVGITESQAARILYLLTWADLARSRRGFKGGFVLTRPPETIRVEEVMRFFHVPAEENAAEPADPLLQVWRETTTCVEREWGELTLLDLVARTGRPDFYVCDLGKTGTES